MKGWFRCVWVGFMAWSAISVVGNAALRHYGDAAADFGSLLLLVLVYVLWRDNDQLSEIVRNFKRSGWRS